MAWLKAIAVNAALLACVAWFVATYCVHWITPEEMTASAIDETFYRIHLYGVAEHTVPPSLDVLPRRDGYANRTMDGWDRPLHYSIDEAGVLTLSSLGRDDEVGGKGPDQDVSESYRSRRDDGSLWLDDEMWIVDAEVR